MYLGCNPMAQAFAEDPANKAEVAEEARRNAMRGVSGVPFFRLNGADACSGAQPPALLLEMINEAAAGS